MCGRKLHLAYTSRRVLTGWFPGAKLHTSCGGKMPQKKGGRFLRRSCFGTWPCKNISRKGVGKWKVEVRRFSEGHKSEVGRMTRVRVISSAQGPDNPQKGLQVLMSVFGRADGRIKSNPMGSKPDAVRQNAGQNPETAHCINPEGGRLGTLAAKLPMKNKCPLARSFLVWVARKLTGCRNYTHEKLLHGVNKVVWRNCRV